MHRRDCLRTLASLALASCDWTKGSTRSPEGNANARRAPKPRNLVLIFLSGGLDSILTTDPKTRSDVHPWVDLTYSPNEIFEVGKNPYGPNLAPLSRWLHKFAILRGVQTRTQAHTTGLRQYLAQKLASGLVTPPIGELIGANRDGQAVRNMMFGSQFEGGFAYTGGSFSNPEYEKGGARIDGMTELMQAGPEAMRRIARVQRDQAGGLATRADGQVVSSRLLESATLLDRLSGLAPCKLEAWPGDPGLSSPFFLTDGKEAWDVTCGTLQRMLWTLEHDLSACIFWQPVNSFDTHTDNDKNQHIASARIFGALAHFLDRLHTVKNAHGTLAEQTTIVLGSELGRYPRLNEFKGKDHLPEATYLVFGPTITPGVFGQSDKSMLGLPISLKTGRPETNGHSLTVEDIGTTLLRMMGADPLRHGYGGRNLDFLVSGAA
jgi:hypothetical protein